MKISTHLQIGTENQAPKKDPDNEVPHGAFWNSCINVGWDPSSKLLTATCYDKKQKQHNTSLTVAPGYITIENCDGELRMNFCPGG